MNKIYIHRGDSTIFANVEKFLTFYIDTPLDLTGWSAKFTLGFVVKEITDISNKSFEVVLDSEDTKQLRLGFYHGAVILTDSNGNIKTVINDIPFEVTNKVVENEYQEIDLTIPESSGVDVKLKVGSQGVGGAVSSVNGMTGDVYLNIPSIQGLATEQQLKDGLATKQPVGNYATQLDVMQAIASIPQFKLSIVNSLPETGEKMVLYFVPKEGVDNDIYNEYVWIEQNNSFEFLGTTAVDLTDYVTKNEFNTTIGDIETILDEIIGG